MWQNSFKNHKLKYRLFVFPQTIIFENADYITVGISKKIIDRLTDYKNF